MNFLLALYSLHHRVFASLSINFVMLANLSQISFVAETLRRAQSRELDIIAKKIVINIKQLRKLS